MKNFKKIITLFFSLVLCITFVLPVLTVCAATQNPTITLDNKSIMPGEKATINVKIKNNPGIMGMAFCVEYDKSALEYDASAEGFISDSKIVNHADQGYLSVVSVAGEAMDMTDDGVIIAVTFKAKDDAPAGKYIINLANCYPDKYGNQLNNSFSNSKGKYVVPTVVSGSITVGGNCKNGNHEFGAWQIKREASCTENGYKERTCKNCTFVDKEDIPITHDYDTEWTVDKVATPESDGTMSRHCKKCNAVTDVITFTYKEVNDNNSGITDGNDSSNNSSDDNTSSENTSSETSSNTNSNASYNTNSNASSSINSNTTTTSGSSSNTTSSDTKGNTASLDNKTPIKNTLGAKNPLSAVENLEDYKENIKPSIDNSTTDKEDKDDKNDTETGVSSNETAATDTDGNASQTVSSDSNDQKNDKSENSEFPYKTLVLIVFALLTVGIIAVAVLLILRNKKS